MASEDTVKALEIEAERRRKAAAAKSRAALPDSIAAIHHTMVNYTVNPKALPFSQADSRVLRNLLNERLRLKFRSPNIDPAAFARLGLDPAKMTDDVLLDFLLGAEAVQLVFQDGRYPTGPNSFVAIETLVIARENIMAEVRGVTEIAEIVIAEAFNSLWESSGAAKKWDSHEVQSEVQMVSFRTSTKVKLGTDMRSLLNNGLVQFLDENVSSGQRLGPRMVACSRYDDFKPSVHAVASWSLDELSLEFHVFNKLTGRQETSALSVSTQTKDERGRGIFQITSELPFDDHVNLVQSLVELLSR